MMQPEELVYYLIAGGIGAAFGVIAGAWPSIKLEFHAQKILSRASENLNDAAFIRRDAEHILEAANKLRAQADDMYGDYMKARAEDGS